MTRFRSALLFGAVILTLGVLAIPPVMAQQITTDPGLVSYDGLTLASQTPQTQQLFLGTFGGRANEVWVLEHNAELVAAGFPIPMPSQSGAQVSSSSDDNENEGNDNGSNDNRNNDNSDRNDNGRHNDNR